MSTMQCGSLHRLPVPIIADRVARKVLDYVGLRAVTIDPEGRVWVEAPDEAAEVDVVGYYTRDSGLLALSRQLLEDIRHERDVRGLVPRPKRQVLNKRARAA